VKNAVDSNFVLKFSIVHLPRPLYWRIRNSKI